MLLVFYIDLKNIRNLANKESGALHYQQLKGKGSERVFAIIV